MGPRPGAWRSAAIRGSLGVWSRRWRPAALERGIPWGSEAAHGVPRRLHGKSRTPMETHGKPRISPQPTPAPQRDPLERNPWRPMGRPPESGSSGGSESGRARCGSLGGCSGGRARSGSAGRPFYPMGRPIGPGGCARREARVVPCPPDADVRDRGFGGFALGLGELLGLVWVCAKKLDDPLHLEEGGVGLRTCGCEDERDSALSIPRS